ncbi:MAG: hypothetical protein B7X02_00650 [Rhodospirillales bacterium 12-54-5]|nr:MAG: hypothetical protein B7X02_00650 [Rhodospirillales bacterium 12-54-5]
MSKFRLSTEGIIRHENDLFEEARLSALQQLERAMGDFVIALPKTDAPVQGKRTGTQDKSIW